MTVSVLFCDPRGSYSQVPGLDLWPEERDAREYAELNPIVAHPPCNWKRYRRQLPAWYPGGTDGGCFASALLSLFACGGVLDWSRKPGTHQIGWFDRNKPTCGKREASATPPAFRDVLLALARHSGDS